MMMMMMMMMMITGTQMFIGHCLGISTSEEEERK
jgi:hypothetical protein